jgi:hypothetical protein
MVHEAAILEGFLQRFARNQGVKEQGEDPQGQEA